MWKKRLLRSNMEDWEKTLEKLLKAVTVKNRLILAEILKQQIKKRLDKK